MPAINDGQFWVLFALLIINLAGLAFTYGGLTQTVRDLCRRVDRLEKLNNGREK